MFICLVNVVLGSISALMGILMLAAGEPGEERLSGLIYLVVAGVSVAIGTALLMRHPRALYWTRNLWRANLILSVFTAVLSLVLDENPARGIAPPVGAIIGYAIWSNYFKKSVRVANTYPGQRWEGW